MKNICLLGATGSIGQNTLKVIASYPEKFKLVACTFHLNIEDGRKIIQEFAPLYVSVAHSADAERLAKEFPKVAFGYGLQGLITAATLSEVTMVLTAVTGSVGLEPTLAAIDKGKQVALANKETLVMGGELVMAAAAANQVQILPVDSEHSAIFQCLAGQPKEQVKSLVITASGGSFRDYSRDQLVSVTRKEALKHPNWSMGPKITIDSATMMNKGLEVIEAHWLFNMPYEQINVILHRESVVHSLIELIDGAYLAQLGASDMREAIQYALTYPNRQKIQEPTTFDLTEIGSLHFEKMNLIRFPLLQVAYDVGKAGGTVATVFNAANEVAVAAFLADKISYLSIESYIQQAVHCYENRRSQNLEELLAIDVATRKTVAQWIEKGVYE